MSMDEPYNGASGRTGLEATTVWCGGCGIWFGSNIYRTIDAETDGALLDTFLSDGFTGLNTCICPSCSWRHIAQEPLAIHFPQRRQFFLFVPSSLRHRAQTIRTEFLASVAAAPGVHVPRYVFEPILVGSRTELKQLIGTTKGVSRLVEDDYSSIGSGSIDAPGERSVAKRSQTLNLLAELVGEDPEDILLEAEVGSSVADRPTEPLDMGGLNLVSDHAPSQDDLADSVVDEVVSADLDASIDDSLEEAVTSGSGSLDADGSDGSSVSFDELSSSSSSSSLSEDAMQASVNESDVDPSLDGSASESDSVNDAFVTQRELEAGQLLPNRDVTAEVAQIVREGVGTEEDDSTSGADVEPSESMDESLPDYESEALLSDVREREGESTEDNYSEGYGELSDAQGTSDFVDVSGEDITGVDAEDESESIEDIVPLDEASDENTASLEEDEVSQSSQLDSQESEAARQPMISGSVELSAEYSKELEAHSRPPEPFDAGSHDFSESEAGSGSDGGVLLDGDLEELDVSDVELESEPIVEDGVWLTEQGVVLRLKLTAEEMGSLNNQQVRVVPQLHELEAGKVCTLTLLGIENQGGLPLHWTLMGQERDAILEQLSARFAVCLELHSDADGKGLLAEYAYPLEANAAAIKRRLEETSSAEEESAKAALQASDFQSDLTHSFHQESFVALESASAARFALGIVEFWSTPQRGNLLWTRMGFPLDWWQDIQSRVLRAAYESGLPVSEEHLERTLAILDIDNEHAYVAGLLEHFLEVCLRIRPNGLDIVQIAGVWDQLLARAQSLDIDVDAEVEALASQAMDEAEMALEDEAGYSDESMDAIEISLADAMEVASIGGIDVRDFAVLNRPTGSMVASNMADKTSDELLAALEDDTQRLDASLTLLARRDVVSFEALHEAILKMPASELTRVLPAMLPMIGDFVGFFRGGLFADEHVQRLAAAAVLVEHKDDRVINPLLAMILDPEEVQWSVLALCAARFGTAVGKPALSRISIDESSTDRIVYLLTAIECVSPGTLDALTDDMTSESVRGCIDSARKNGEAFDVSFVELSFEDRVAQLLTF